VTIFHVGLNHNMVLVRCHLIFVRPICLQFVNVYFFSRVRTAEKNLLYEYIKIFFDIV